MTEFFRLATSNLFVFVGVCILGTGILNFLLTVVSEITRAINININKQGWPSQKKEEENND